MAGGSGAPTAAPNPFGPQSTPMGGGSSPLNTGGGFSGGFGGGQTVGTMGGFGGDLGTAGTMGGFGGNLGTAGMGGQQNSGSLLMRPENPIPYTGPTDPSQFLNKIAGLSDRLARQQQQPQQQFTPFGGTRGGPISPDQISANRGQFELYTPEHYQQQQPAQSLSFEQWRAQPRMQDQQYRTPEQQLQQDQQAYQRYLSGTDNMQVAQPVPLQNPFQPIEPSYMQDPEYQGYQTQARDLSRQMDEYMKKAPMYQQMQDLQNKMTPFQQRQEMQRMQQMQQRQQYNPYQQQQQPFNPYARQMPQQQMPFNKGMPYRQPAYDPNNMLAGEKNYYDRMAQQRQRQNPYQQQYQQPYGGGLQGLMEMLGGRRGMQQPSMSMGMPQAYYYKNGGKV